MGTREGRRRLRDGVPDFAVVAGPDRTDDEYERAAGWTREWGVLVPAGNPADVTGLADLVDRDTRFVNRGQNSGLRRALDDALATLATDRDTDRAALTDAIDGYDMTVRAHESPARRVAAGDADAGLGLRATAEQLGLGFVSLGEQSTSVLVNPERTGKEGVAALREVVENADAVLADLPGYATE